MKPSCHPLVNVVTGQKALNTANVDRALDIGTKQMTGWPESFYEKISRMVKTQAEGNMFWGV